MKALMSIVYSLLVLFPLFAGSTQSAILDNFSIEYIHDETTRPCFLQVAPNEDGSFAVLSYDFPIRVQKYGKDFAEYPINYYIDFYDPVGQYVASIKFYDQKNNLFGVQIESRNDCLYIYCRPHFIIQCDNNAQEFQYYPLPETESEEMDKLEQHLLFLHNAESFTCGDWEYQYYRNIFEGINHYTRFSRTKAGATEYPVDFSGTWPDGFPFIGVMASVIVFVTGVSLSVKKRKKAPPKNKTGDGSSS